MLASNEHRSFEYIGPQHEPIASAAVGKQGISVHADETAAWDDEEERRAGPLLLGKAAVLAHGFNRRLAAEMDETR